MSSLPAKTLILFLKAPRIGAAKTRLARDVGSVEAIRLYRRMAGDVVRRLTADDRWRSVVAYAPDGAKREIKAGFAPWPDVACLPQGSGGLGVRMERALRAAPPGPVVLVGTDCPGVTPAHIGRAFQALGSADMVLGPAEDGGYWLVGLKRLSRPQGLFDGVRMSTEHALADTLANVMDRYEVRLVDRLMDIDTGADLARWRARAG